MCKPQYRQPIDLPDERKRFRRAENLSQRKKPSLSEEDLQNIDNLLGEHPDLTIREIKEILNLNFSVCERNVPESCPEAEICVQKNHCTPTNRNVPDVQEQRANYRKLLAEYATKHLVFLDESEINVNLIRWYGRVKGGAKICDDVLLATPKNTTVLSSSRTNGTCGYTTYRGGTMTEKFVEYLEKHLLLTLDEEKDVLIVGNIT